MHDRTGDCTSLVPADLYELLRQAFEHAESILSTSILTIPLPSGMEPAAVQSSAPPASSQTQLMGASGTAAALSADAAAGTAVAVRASTLEGRMQSEASSSVQPLCVMSPSAGSSAGSLSLSTAPPHIKRRRTSQFIRRAEALADVLERRFGGNSCGSSETASIMRSAVAEFLAQGERHHAETMAVLHALGRTSGGEPPSSQGWPHTSSSPQSYGWPQSSSAPLLYGWPPSSSAPPSLGRSMPAGGRNGGIAVAAAVPEHSTQHLARAAQHARCAPALAGPLTTPTTCHGHGDGSGGICTCCGLVHHRA